MKKSLLRLSMFTLLALPPLTPARALDWRTALENEEAFRAAFGDRAVLVAPGVYQAKLGKGETVRVAFGELGRQYDRDRFAAQLDEAQGRLARMSEPSRELVRKVHRLEDLIAALDLPLSRAAITGSMCSTGQVLYPYSLDGYLSGGSVTAKASAGMDIDFGPRPPSYANRYVDAYATALKGKLGCIETTVSASDSITNGSLGTASATATVACGIGCVGWETFSQATINCPDGYRSLSRSGGLVNACNL